MVEANFIWIYPLSYLLLILRPTILVNIENIKTQTKTREIKINVVFVYSSFSFQYGELS